MPLTTASRVEIYLGSDLTSAQAVEMDLVISSVQEMMESYCNRQFDNDVYYHRRLGSGEREIVLANTPVNELKWAGIGLDTLLTVQYDGSKAASIEVEDNEVRLSENLTTTTISLEDSSITDIDSLVSAIDILSAWTAAAASGYGEYPVEILNPVAKCPLDQDTSYQIDMSGAASWMRLYRQREGLYVSDRAIPEGMPYVVVYDGGYSTVPAGLSQLATEMAAAAWRLYVSHGGGILQSEKIGDYSYKLSDALGEPGATSIVMMYRGRLDQYARIEL